MKAGGGIGRDHHFVFFDLPKNISSIASVRRRHRAAAEELLEPLPCSCAALAGCGRMLEGVWSYIGEGGAAEAVAATALRRQRLRAKRCVNSSNTTRARGKQKRAGKRS